MSSDYDIVNREHRRFSEETGAKSVVDHFGVNNIEEASATITYIGKEDTYGIWMILKINSASGKVFTYATQKNNDSYSTYASAWTDRVDLDYGTYSQAF